MSMDVHAATELTRVTTLRLGVRTVAGYAFKINLLGLNALLLAKRFGRQARGFGVIASELRDFSGTLHDEMAVLDSEGGLLIDLASQLLKASRQVSLLGGSETAAHPTLETAWQARRQHCRQLAARITVEHGRMGDSMARAYQACLYGSVLARSAQIEAAYAGPQGQALVLASQEFTQYIDDILNSLAGLKRTIEERM